MDIYVGDRQVGKTSFLIKESHKTGLSIVSPNYHMSNHVRFMAEKLKINIPEPKTLSDVIKNYNRNGTDRYIVDELQMILDQLNIDVCTINACNVHNIIDTFKSNNTNTFSNFLKEKINNNYELLFIYDYFSNSIIIELRDGIIKSRHHITMEDLNNGKKDITAFESALMAIITNMIKNIQNVNNTI